MTLSILDYILIAVLAVPFILGLFKGFVRMLFGLFGMFGGIVLSIVFARPAGVLIGDNLGFSDIFLGKLLAFILIFVGCGLLGSVGGFIVRKLVKTMKMGLLDRAFGGIFGFLQGVLVVSVLLLVSYLLPVSRPWLDESKFGIQIVRTTVNAANKLPKDWKEYLAPERWIGQSRKMILDVLEDESQSNQKDTKETTEKTQEGKSKKSGETGVTGKNPE